LWFLDELKAEKASLVHKSIKVPPYTILKIPKFWMSHTIGTLHPFKVKKKIKKIKKLSFLTTYIAASSLFSQYLKQFDQESGL